MKNKNLIIIFGTLLSLLLLTISSCRKDDFYTGTDSILNFSVDTLTFDTVFTTVGTVTRYLKVENTSSKSILLDIDLKNLDGLNTYRINVDGISGKSFNDVEILPKDYIYIFVEATINPGNTNSPFIISDAIEYKYNGTIQKSFLQAWGQDAYFHGGIIYSTDAVWHNDKPHVIVGDTSFKAGFGVDSFSTLTIEPGCKIYSSFGRGLYVDGELYIGTAGNQDSVVFQSDRIEDLQNGISFEDKPGLWKGIYILGGAKAEIYNTIINQAERGIQGRHETTEIVDLLDDNGKPDILLDKVRIKNASLNALLAINCKLNVVNSIFYATGQNTVAIALGGKVTFDNCTMYNNGVSGSDDSETLILSNYFKSYKGAGLNHLEQADFTNCIVYGNANEQIIFSKDEQVDFNYQFTNCLLKTQLDTQNGFTNCIINENPNFVNASSGNFYLEDNSPCINTGADNGIYEDIYFNTRSNFDMGAVAY